MNKLTIRIIKNVLISIVFLIFIILAVGKMESIYEENIIVRDAGREIVEMKVIGKERDIVGVGYLRTGNFQFTMIDNKENKYKVRVSESSYNIYKEGDIVRTYFERDGRGKLRRINIMR